MAVLNGAWQQDIINKLNMRETVTVTTGFTKAVQWLVTVLANRGIPFAVHNIAAGVKTVTTDTKTCPCCKRALP